MTRPILPLVFLLIGFFMFCRTVQVQTPKESLAVEQNLDAALKMLANTDADFKELAEAKLTSDERGAVQSIAATMAKTEAKIKEAKKANDLQAARLGKCIDNLETEKTARANDGASFWKWVLISGAIGAGLGFFIRGRF
jgi:hypothetical protein